MRTPSRFTRITFLSMVLLFVAGTLSVLAGRVLVTGKAGGGNFFQKLVTRPMDTGVSRIKHTLGTYTQPLAALPSPGALTVAMAPTWSTAIVPAGVTPQDANNTFFTVAHNGTKFVASGGELNVISSTDGVNWTYDGKMSAATVVSVFDITWIPFLNKWVAATNVNLPNATIYTSSNGTSWTPTNSGLTSGTVNNFATDGTKVIGTVNTGGQLVKSTDASTWSIQTLTGVLTSSLFSIIYEPSTSKWVAVGGSGGIITSPDGNTWTKQTSPVSTGFRAVAYGNGRYVAVSNNAGIAVWSTDAVTWTQSSTGLASQGLTRMTFVNGVFVAVGTNGAIISSTDGATWSAAHDSGTTNQNISDVVANGSGSSAKVVAVGGSTMPIIRHIDASALNTAASPEIAVSETLAGNIADGGSFSFGSTTVGTPVTKTFTVTNSGNANLTLANLSVPTGFSIAANFGSATVAGSGGTTTFQITMTAAAGGTPSGTLTFDNNDADENPFNFTISGTVSCPTITVNPTSLSNAVFGESYSATISASGGTGPYTFAVTTGALPGGLSLSSGGALTGTTNAVNTFNFTITATDTSNGCTGSRAYTSVVSRANTTTTITSDNPDPSVTGQSVTVNFTVTTNSPGSGTPTGNVVVTVSGGAETCTGTVAAGTCTLSLNAAGARTLTATYAQTTNFNGSSDTEAHQVNTANTTTTITSDNPDPSIVGQAVAVNFSVVGAAPGGGTPTGNVVVTISGGAETCTGMVAAGSCTLTLTGIGNRTLTATYAGDANYNGSSDTEAHQVTLANTTTTITSDNPDPSVVGQSVTVNYSVTVNAPGTGTPTGNVVVTVSGGSETCVGTVAAGTCTLTLTSAGARTLTATYAGDANFNGSSDTEAHQVNAANTTTTITSDNPAPSVVGQSVTVNYTVTANSPGAGTPTGNVVVTISGGAETCVGTVAAGTCTLTLTSAGARTLTATYAGDANFNGSSDTEAHQVNAANTTTTITSANPDPSVVGQSVTVNFTTLSIAPGAGTPTGNVVVTISGGAETCTGTVAAGTCTITLTSAGARTLTATYAGNADFNGSSDTEAHQVNAANTTTTISSDNPDPSIVGQAVTVNFSVTAIAPGGGTPTGNVVVTISGGAETCTGTIAAGTCTLTLTNIGNRTLTATYAGDANYNGSSDTEAHQVTLANTTTTITSYTPDPSVTGQAYNVAANVAVTPPGTGTPTGTVTVSDGTGGTCTITLPAASCILTSTTAGAKTLTATYSGDANFNGSTSAGVSHTVNKADTTAAIFSDAPDPSVVGQNVTVTYTVSVTSPGAGTPTGNVLVSDGVNSCTGTVTAGQCVIALFTPGVRTLTATYQGDANYNASPASTGAGHQVNKADTTTTITSDNPDPSVFGQAITVNFTVAAAAPGSGTPTGNVVVTVSGGTETCTGTVAAGSCTLALTAVGNRTLTATYQGDTSYNGSTSAGAPHTANQADTVTTIVSDNPDSSFVGQNLTVVFTVLAVPPGVGTATGNVVVTASGGAETCTGTVAGGSCVITLTTPGARTLTATYAGDTNFNGGTDTEPHTVVAPPSISKAFSPASVPVGQTSTLTFTITNPAANTVALTVAGFTDNFPNSPNLVVATPLTTTNTCGGTLQDGGGGALTAGDTGIMLTGGTVGTGGTCTVSVNVTPNAQGPFVNISGNVTSTNGGTGNTATATLATNTPPTISSDTLTVKAGSNAASFTIATAVDPDQPVNTLGITINGNPTTASGNGVTVSGVTITPSGAVTANIATTCAATSATFNLVVTDNQNATGTGTLTVTVTPNTPPMLGYNPQTVIAGTTPSINPAAGPSDNGTVNPLMLQGVSPNNGGLTVSLNAATGAVTVLSAALIGSYTVTITATDNCGATTTATLVINVVCPTITLSPASLPGVTINTAYSQTISASPAGGNYSFAVTSGLLPAGLTLNSNGAFSGAPTQSGTFNFRITTTGFGGCTGFQDYVLIVSCPTITVDPSSLPGGSVGASYSQTVAGSPAGTYSYAVSSGALPAGLTLNASTGAITGTPTTTGSFNFTITAATSGGGSCSGSRTYTVAITCSTITLSPTSPLPGGQAGVAYSQTISVSPAGSHTFSLISGSLPSGITLNPATGVISGLPSTVGSFTFTIKAQTAGGCNATQSYTLAITCPTVALSPASLPNGTTGTAYTQTISASPSGGGYTYAVTIGSLPAGLNLNSSTGVLSGTPTAGGTFNFRITATGFGGCTGFRDYTVVISGGGCPTITLPASLPNGNVGQLYNAAATASPAGLYSYTITSGSVPPGVTLFGANGLLFGYPTAVGSYTFTVTATQGACSGNRMYTVLIGAGFASSLTVFSDFDGDGKSDLSVWRGSDGNWLVANSGDGKVEATPWGASYAPYNDVTVSGDYDGDGKTDLAVFRRGGEYAGYWFIKQSSDGQVKSHFWGLGTDVPVPGDYDGDGKTDVAVWRGSAGAWYIVRSSDGGIDARTWGFAPLGDVPVPGDYDGDGKTDVAVFRRSTGFWYIRRSSDSLTISTEWGVGTDVPVPGDYDGDNRTDIAVWRALEGNWYIVESSSAVTRTVSLGAAAQGDVPAVADYDGDGKADPALWQPSTGVWTIKRSRDNVEMSKVHGQSGDVPIMSKRN